MDHDRIGLGWQLGWAHQKTRPRNQPQTEFLLEIHLVVLGEEEL